MKHLEPTEEALDWSSPWKSRSDWFPNDQLLREAGYKILSRRKGQEARWLDRRGRVVTHGQALEAVQRAMQRSVKGSVKPDEDFTVAPKGASPIT